MKAIKVLNYVPNPRGINGTTVFNKSNTKTPYQRFNALGPDADGNQIAILLMLNANQVETLSVLPELMQGKEIHIDDVEWEVALEATRAFEGVTTVAITNFSMEPSGEIIDTKLRSRAEITVAREREASKEQNKARESFLGLLATGQAKSRLDPRLQNRGGLAAPAGEAIPTGSETGGKANDN